MNAELEKKAFNFVKNKIKTLLMSTQNPVIIIAVFEDLASNDRWWFQDERFIELNNHHRTNLTWEKDSRFLNKVKRICTEIINEVDFTRDRYLLNVFLDLQVLGELKKNYVNCYEFLNHKEINFN